MMRTPRSYPHTAPVSVAPMMECTDRHYRYFLRGITRRTLLYTEMITTGAVLYGDGERILSFDPEEHPLSLQLGGDDPRAVAEAVRIASDFGYDEYNLNVGCPSERVQTGSFGACLMARPRLVAGIVEAMKGATAKPVTVKHRIGIDGLESYDDLRRFVETVANAGADRVTIHARIAVLGGLSPKENRKIPPIRYEDVYRLKEEMPELPVEINGHIKSEDEISEHLERVDAVMIGRAAYDDPCMLAGVDERFFGDAHAVPSRHELATRMIPYMEQWVAAGFSPRVVLRHMLGLFAFQPGARRWKQALSGRIDESAPPEELLQGALEQVPEEIRHAPLIDPVPA